MTQQEQEYQEAEINFRETVPAGRGVRIVKSYRQDGTVTQVMFHFPLGCNALVRMRLLKDEKEFYPIKDYMALNDATPIFYTYARYEKNEHLTLEILNQDAANAHTVSCTVVIRYKKPWWY